VSLSLRPIRQRDAFAFVRQNHRHNTPPRGSVFQVAVVDEDGDVVAVAIAGRPTARMLDDGETLEVLRVCSTGARNACSMLYGACQRAGHALGYRKVITYTLASEPGSSLRGAGYQLELFLPESAGWDRPSRPRPGDPSPRGAKMRWSA